MKKLLLGLCALFSLGASVQAEMYWFGLDPTTQAGAAGIAGGVLNPDYATKGTYDGFDVALTIVDSSSAVDSSYGTWYTTCINTEDVISATGLIEMISITDTSTTTGHLFALAGDSVYATWILKTGYVPYDANAQTLVAATVLNAASGATARDPITLTFEGDEGVDSLFKPYTWFEITCWDSTRWAEVNTAADPVPLVDSSITGTWVPADTLALAGTYGGGGTLGRYHIQIYDPGTDKDSIISTVYYGDLVTVDTTVITESAQAIPDGIDSSVTVNFDDDDTATDGDVFIFYMSDSLHYGKTVELKMRAGLNVHKRK